MKKLFALATVALLLAVTNTTQAAPSIVGKWQAHSMTAKGKTQEVPPGMKITVEFTKDGKFIGTMEASIEGRPPEKKVEEGTYKVKGRTLTTTAKKTETMVFKIKGRTLSLTKAKRDETLILKRVE